MAVKQCLECGGEVERWERTCPHCGSSQNPLITKLLVLAVIIAMGFVAWEYLFPKLINTRILPGMPALTRPSSPTCATEDLIVQYYRLDAAGDQVGTDNLLVHGCALAREDVPVTVLRLSSDSSGMALVQGFFRGRASNFWIHQSDLKPYRPQ